MNNMRVKFEEARKLHESKLQQLVHKINLKNKFSINTYNSGKNTVLLCEKEIDYSEIEDEYYILDDDNNEKLFYVNEYYLKYEDVLAEIEVVKMCILIPKDKERSTLFLMIKRMSSSYIRFWDASKKNKVKVNNLFCEEDVSIKISEYDFSRELKIKEQAWSIDASSIIDYNFIINKNDYKEFLEEYIRNTYLNKIFTFKIDANKDFKKYIKSALNNKKSGKVQKLAYELQKNYEELKNMELNLPTEYKKIEGTTIIYSVCKCENIMNVKVENENQELVTIIESKEPILVVKYYDRGYGSEIHLIEGRTFEDVLSSKFGTEFIIDSSRLKKFDI